MLAMRIHLATQPTALTRVLFDQLIELTPAAAGVTYRDDRVGGVPGTWCIPPSGRAGRAVLYLHGGAYVFGSARAFRHLAGQLATSAGIDVFVADYRLAPEHAFPAALEDATGAYCALANELGTDHVAIAGDSAGGGLALAVLAAHRAAPCGVLLSPWTDLTLTAESLDARAADDPVLSRAALEAGATAYLRGHDVRDPRASPVFGELANLARLQVHVGTAEILLDDADRLDALAGAEVHIWEGMPHVFPLHAATLEAAREALTVAGTFLRQGIAEGGARS